MLSLISLTWDNGFACRLFCVAMWCARARTIKLRPCPFTTTAKAKTIIISSNPKRTSIRFACMLSIDFPQQWRGSQSIWLHEPTNALTSDTLWLPNQLSMLGHHESKAQSKLLNGFTSRSPCRNVSHWALAASHGTVIMSRHRVTILLHSPTAQQTKMM